MTSRGKKRYGNRKRGRDKRREREIRPIIEEEGDKGIGVRTGEIERREGEGKRGEIAEGEAEGEDTGWGDLERRDIALEER
jgi:hypothetical protein